MAEAPRERGAALLEGAGPHLFLSHSRGDNAFVTELARNLNSCGVDVWLDTWELRPGERLEETIADAIAKSRYVAVVVGEAFDNSKWVQGEVYRALARESEEGRTVVIPLLLSEVDLPESLDEKKCLDLAKKDYFPSVLELAGAVLDLPREAMSDAIHEYTPTSMKEVIDALRYAGHEPFCIVDNRMLEEIERLGGRRSGSRVVFDPERIADQPSASPPPAPTDDAIGSGVEPLSHPSDQCLAEPHLRV